MSVRPFVFPLTLAAAGVAAFSSCGDDEPGTPTVTGEDTCPNEVAPFEVGDPEGHPDPLGAAAAGQARAGRIAASDVPQPAHGRQRIEDGDYLLINDKIAVVIEGVGRSDAYDVNGGGIVAFDQVGDDGRPRGVSYFNETLTGLGLSTVHTESVSVLNDGSDGEAAVIRVMGPMEPIPFVKDAFGKIFGTGYDVLAAFDYVLEPGSERLRVRFGVVNDTPRDLDFGVNREGSDESYGFFQESFSQAVTAEHGYESATGTMKYVGFDAGEWGFAYQGIDDERLEFGFQESGFLLMWGEGFAAPGCAATMVDQYDVIGGGPHYDGLRAAIRRVNGEPAWREVTGQVLDYAGLPVADAWVHELDEAGNYLSRTRADGMGRFTLHAPDERVRVIPEVRGYPPHDGALLEPTTDELDLAFAPHGFVHVTATDEDYAALPVRVQLIPLTPIPERPESFGVLEERNGRLHQAFAMNGDVVLIAPEGEHRVVVSRGFEWELLDTTVTVTAGESTDVTAVLSHSVDSTDVMCADFHIHSFMSADSPDSHEDKIVSAVADGLEIPVSSEHQWVVDFQPIVEDLGLADWAFGGSSLELTTFVWGHFGVVPIYPRPNLVNHGAIDWVDRKPVDVFGEVHALDEEPVIIVNHPSGGSFAAYFSTARLSKDTGTSQSDLWSDDFDAVEVFNSDTFEDNRDDSVRHWFALLNRGKRAIGVGSSDSHKIVSSPVGYPRTCLWFGHDDPRLLSGEVLRDAVRSGRATVSGGLFLTVTSDTGAGPGDTISGAGEHAFSVTVQAPSWISGDTLEVIVDGVTVEEQPLLPIGSGPENRYVNDVSVTFDGSATSWIVFHVKGAADLDPLYPGKQPFAVSNPIFVEP